MGGHFCHLKIQNDLALTLTMPPKVKPMVPFYVPLKVKLLSETFSRIFYTLRDISMQKLKWDPV